jgi:hypothetical protein
MKSRRRICLAGGSGVRQQWHYTRDLRPAEWGLDIILRGNNPHDRMSTLGQKRTSEQVRAMSALPPKADIHRLETDVAFPF